MVADQCYLLVPPFKQHEVSRSSGRRSRDQQYFAALQTSRFDPNPRIVRIIGKESANVCRTGDLRPSCLTKPNILGKQPAQGGPVPRVEERCEIQNLGTWGQRNFGL